MNRLYFAMLKQTEKVGVIRDLSTKKFKDQNTRNEWLVYLAKNEMVLRNMQSELGDRFCIETEKNNLN